MIEINGKRYNTLIDAANFFGISSKTVRDWIKKKVIPKPPQIRQGLREIDYYPKEYLDQALKIIDKYRNKK